MIPRTLDAPALFLFWEAETVMIWITVVLGGFALDVWYLGVAFGAVAGRAWTALKSDGGRGLLVRILYFHTPSGLWLGRCLPSFQREFLGE